MNYSEAKRIKNSLKSNFIKDNDRVYEIWITPARRTDYQHFLNLAMQGKVVDDKAAKNFSSNNEFVLQKVLFYPPYFLHDVLTSEKLEQLPKKES